MIERKELLRVAREQGIGLAMAEKDYVLGWLIFGFSKIKALCFTGGTALSKIYFPRVWRLSEDLDYIFGGEDFSEVTDSLPQLFAQVSKMSENSFRLKSSYQNPFYLQLKIQYSSVLWKNWAKVDVTKDLVGEIKEREMPKSYSDYPKASIKVETLESILAGKLRAMTQRTKCRDYYDVWRMKDENIDFKKMKEILKEKCEAKEIEFSQIPIFPDDLTEILTPYWERELSRVLHPVPEMEDVIIELKSFLSYGNGFSLS